MTLEHLWLNIYFNLSNLVVDKWISKSRGSEQPCLNAFQKKTTAFLYIKIFLVILYHCFNSPWTPLSISLSKYGYPVSSNVDKCCLLHESGRLATILGWEITHNFLQRSKDNCTSIVSRNQIQIDYDDKLGIYKCKQHERISTEQWHTPWILFPVTGHLGPLALFLVLW